MYCLLTEVKTTAQLQAKMCFHIRFKDRIVTVEGITANKSTVPLISFVSKGKQFYSLSCLFSTNLFKTTD